MAVTLLAHRRDATEAIVQLENGKPYFYKFGAHVDTYSLITNTQHEVGRGWEHNYKEKKIFPTIAHLKLFVKEQAAE